MTRKITYEDVKKEVINRQKKFGKGDPDKCKNAIFKGIKYEDMVTLLYYWPRCNKCHEFLELEIKYNEFQEIPLSIIWALSNIQENIQEEP